MPHACAFLAVCPAPPSLQAPVRGMPGQARSLPMVVGGGKHVELSPEEGATPATGSSPIAGSVGQSVSLPLAVMN